MSSTPNQSRRVLQIAPSILSADVCRHGDQVGEALDAGVRWIHVDVMDGQFVPNISFGPLVVEALRPLARSYDATIAVSGSGVFNGRASVAENVRALRRAARVEPAQSAI